MEEAGGMHRESIFGGVYPAIFKGIEEKSSTGFQKTRKLYSFVPPRDRDVNASVVNKDGGTGTTVTKVGTAAPQRKLTSKLPAFILSFHIIRLYAGQAVAIAKSWGEVESVGSVKVTFVLSRSTRKGIADASNRVTAGACAA